MNGTQMCLPELQGNVGISLGSGWVTTAGEKRPEIYNGGLQNRLVPQVPCRCPSGVSIIPTSVQMVPDQHEGTTVL